MDNQERFRPGPGLSVGHLLILSSVVLALGSPAMGQTVDCADQSRNVLRYENCGFRSGIAGWPDLSGANPRWSGSEGNPSPGSYALDSEVDEDGDRAATILSPCVPIARSATYEISGEYRIVDPSDEVTCELAAARFSNSRCTGQPVGGSAETRVTGSQWVSLADTFTSRSIDRSMLVFTVCYEDASGPVFTMLMDNFVVSGPVSRSPIFSNGFESGDTSAWSRTVP